MADLVCLGELLIDFVPTVAGSRIRDVAAFERAAGGAPANVAAGFAKLGGSSAFVGKVGDDEFGYFLEDTLRGAGIDITNLIKTTQAQTSLAFVSLRKDGERDFLFYRNPGADVLLTPEEVPLSLLQGSHIFHYGSISLISEPSRSATLHSAQTAADFGKLISYDPNLRPALWPNLTAAQEGIRQGLKWSNLLKVSQEELAFITGVEQISQATEVLFTQYSRLKLIAVTLGAQGSLLSLKDGRSFAIDPFSVQVVDTTGAGDGFTAGLLYRLNLHLAEAGGRGALWDQSDHFWQEAGIFANKVGALVVTRRGAIGAMPSLGFLDNLP